MGEYLYQVVTINGKIVAFEADQVISDDERHTFMVDGEVVGEFERKNIAGYFESPLEEYDDEDA